jgi:hypothetical protein
LASSLSSSSVLVAIARVVVSKILSYSLFTLKFLAGGDLDDGAGCWTAFRTVVVGADDDDDDEDEHSDDERGDGDGVVPLDDDVLLLILLLLMLFVVRVVDAVVAVGFTGIAGGWRVTVPDGLCQ